MSIQYYFDRLLLEYPAHHYVYTNEHIQLNKDIQDSLTRHLAGFNDTSLISNVSTIELILIGFGKYSEQVGRIRQYQEALQFD